MAGHLPSIYGNYSQASTYTSWVMAISVHRVTAPQRVRIQGTHGAPGRQALTPFEDEHQCREDRLSKVTQLAAPGVTPCLGRGLDNTLLSR